MSAIFAIFSGAVSGVCLLAIIARKKLPLVGTLASPKLKIEIDSTDKRLAIVSLVFFILCMICTAIYYG